jgi:hypothetical protein
MKPYQRRAAGKPTFYKLAEWDERVLTYRDGKIQFDDRAAAFAAAMKSGPGRYRISRVDADGRHDFEPFDLPN